MTVQLSNGIIKSYDREGSVSEMRGWLSMRMIEKKVLLFLALMFLCICSPMRAEARAGGAVTPVGNTVEEFWSSVREGKIFSMRFI